MQRAAELWKLVLCLILVQLYIRLGASLTVQSYIMQRAAELWKLVVCLILVQLYIRLGASLAVQSYINAEGS